MFERLKRAAAVIAARGMFDSTMKAVRSAPHEVQVEILRVVLPKIMAITGMPDGAERFEQVRELADQATQVRQAAAHVADHEADPRWTPWALLESWAVAALLDQQLFDHVHGTLDSWFLSVSTTPTTRLTEKPSRAPATVAPAVAPPPPPPPAPATLHRASHEANPRSPEQARFASRPARPLKDATDEHPRAAYWSQLGGRVTKDIEHCPTCAKGTNTTRVKTTLLCCWCGRPRQGDAA